MATDVVLPQWGMNMLEGTLNKWLKQEGDAVEKGEPIVEIETDKIDSELEATESGKIAYILVPEGDTVPVGTVLAIIAAPDEVVARPAPRSQRPAASATPSSPRPLVPSLREPSIQVVPAARRLASQHGIDLASLLGSGPAGRILEEDVQRAIERPAQPAGRRLPLTATRKKIAARMLESMRNMAQLTLTTEADVTAVRQLQSELVVSWREQRERPRDLIFPIKAIARALREQPVFNARLAGDDLELLDDVNVGFAVSIEQGLIVPVVKRADEKSLIELNRDVAELARKAQRGQLAFSDVEGGTFTLTTLGPFDIDAFTPIILPPQVAILGTGRITEKPAVYKGEIARRFMMFLSLTFDHRATDGEPAARFLKRIKEYLEDPFWMEE